MHTISINTFLSRINFKQVAYIKPVSTGGGSENACRDDGDVTSAVNFLGSSTLLTAQPLDYFRALAHGRMLDVPYTDFKTGVEMKRLVPLDAIHHLELVSRREDEAEHYGHGGTEHPQARIIYRAYDPACPERHCQMPVPASLIDALLDRDEGGLIDIGGGKFVFADEIENARPMEAKNIARLAQCEEDGPDRPPVSIIELSDAAFIPSSFHVQTVEGMVRRPLPSACPPSFHYEAGLSA